MKQILILIGLFGLISCSHKGEPLPQLQATTLSGKVITNKSLKGKVTVIKIWATWCGPCLNGIDDMNRLEEDYANDTNVVFLAITDDNREKITNFLSVKDFRFEHITDAKPLMETLHKGMVQYYPEHLVVDKNLNIVFDETEAENVGDTLRSLIEQLK